MFMARIPPRIIEVAKDRLLNLHPALLPAYRGLSSLSSMQYDGTAADFAGLTLHVVEEEFDTGPIIAKVAVPPPPTGSFADHLHALIVVGGKLLGQAVPAYLEGQLPAMPQDDETARRWKSHAETDLVVRSSHRMSEIQEIFTSVGPLHKLALEGSPPSIKVDGFRSRLGPSRSLPMRLRWKSIDFDLADGRVRLRRASPWRDRLRNIALMRRLVQLTLSSSSART
jgi:methionyl-tRNA formyltransferase